MTHYQAASLLAPYTVQNYLGMADLMENQKDVAGMHHWYQALLAVAPHADGPRLRYAKVLMDEGNYRSAAKHLERVQSHWLYPQAVLQLARIDFLTSGQGQVDQILRRFALTGRALGIPDTDKHWVVEVARAVRLRDPDALLPADLELLLSTEPSGKP